MHLLLLIRKHTDSVFFTQCIDFFGRTLQLAASASAVAVHWRVKEGWSEEAVGTCKECQVRGSLPSDWCWCWCWCWQCRMQTVPQINGREGGRSEGEKRSYQRMDEWLTGADSKRCANWEISQVASTQHQLWAALASVTVSHLKQAEPSVWRLCVCVSVWSYHRIFAFPPSRAVRDYNRES